MRVSSIGAFVVTLACIAGAGDAESGGGAGAEAVRRLLQVNGAARMTMQTMTTLSAQARKGWPQVPDYIWAEILAEFREEDVTDFLIPIYQRYFTDEDVRGLLAFYESPAGKKLLEVQPQLLGEAAAAGQRWGDECFNRAWNRLRARGYAPKPIAQGGGAGRRRTRG